MLAGADLASTVSGLAGTAGAPAFVVSANTFPNATALDAAGGPVIDVELAGFAGPALKPIVLGQVRQLRRLLQKAAVPSAELAEDAHRRVRVLVVVRQRLEMRPERGHNVLDVRLHDGVQIV